MQKIEIDLPDELAEALRTNPGRIGDVVALGLRQIKIVEALTLYQRDAVSFGRAVEIAGISREELIRQARAAGIHPRWTDDTLREELA